MSSTIFRICIVIVLVSMFGSIRVVSIYAAPSAQNALIPVIVTLKNTTRIEQTTSSAYSKQVRRALIRGAQIRLTQRYADDIHAIKHAYSVLPSIALQVDADALALLRADPEVASVVIDRPQPIMTEQNINVINAPVVYNAGYTGAGMTVAVLDTGIAKNHPFLQGKVVAEACFSSNNASDGAVSLCPNHATQSFAANSAEPCAKICGHGTHVAGIVAGNRVSLYGRQLAGVAPDAALISVQVYSEFPASNSWCGGVKCILSYDSDQIAALEWLYTNRNTPEWKKLVAVNMSLGGDAAHVACDSEPIKAAIDQLRSVNVATIIASGNQYHTDSVSFPACVSSAIAVGSSSFQVQGYGNTYVEGFSTFSNAPTAANNTPNTKGDRLLDLLAPGENIYSSYPADSYAAMSGTSMATPHVAGAWALLRSAKPDATVSEVLNALYATGRMLHDNRAGGSVTVARINVLAAISQFVVIPTATATTTRTPIIKTTPTFTASRTATLTYTRTATRTATATFTASHTRTNTNTRTATATKTMTRTATATFTASNTRTATATVTASNTRTATATVTVSNTRTYTRTATGTRTATETRTATATQTGTSTQTAIVTATATDTATPSPTAVPAP